MSTTSLEAQRCKVYVHELNHDVLSAHRLPPAWPTHQHAIEHHLAAAAKRSPWRTHDRSDADLVLALGNFSLLCAAGKTFSRRRLWFQMLGGHFFDAIYRQKSANLSPSAMRDAENKASGSPFARGQMAEMSLGTLSTIHALLDEGRDRGNR